MAIYHAPDDPNKSTFAGGTMSQAMAKHKHLHGDKKDESPKDKLKMHLDKASEHLEHAKAAHAGTMSEDQASDPHEVNEEIGGGGISAMGGGEQE